MALRFQEPDEHELDSRALLGSEEHLDFRGAEDESRHDTRRLSWVGRRLLELVSWLSSTLLHGLIALLRPIIRPFSHPRFATPVKSRRRVVFLIQTPLIIVLVLICFTAVFWPSYTHLPAHYKALIGRVEGSQTHGRGNSQNEKIYIAAALYDPEGLIADGQWGHALLQLIELLGEDNVFLGIYENNSGEKGESALHRLANQVTCNHSIVAEPDLGLTGIPRVLVPGGEERVRRIDYLADVRNRALRPLDQQVDMKFDKLLYLNDVIFNPVEALQLLFSTNADSDGIAQYRAACAVDFSNAFKFYDTYATRDLQGYGIGLPFYPWFTTTGNGQSRQDVLEGRDAVRVRSCWGGMVAFDARFFQGANPVRFRADSELFWDASECCIIHADIQKQPSTVDEISDTGIYMNPFIRVAYDSRSHSWLWVTRRFERLYPFIHNILNHLIGLPLFNPRRTDVPGQAVEQVVWVPNTSDAGQQGAFQVVERVAANDGFCGRRGMEVIVESRRPGQDGFEPISPPQLAEGI